MVKLLPSELQSEALEMTLRRVNEACDYASGVAWETRTFSKYKLQQETYHPIKERFGLTAQVVIRLLSKVTDAYKLDRKRKRTFRPLGAIAYDDRILRWYEDDVSIWTVADKSRQRIPFVCDERTRALLGSRRGESDLVYRSGKWYLLATVEVEEPPPGTPEDWLGVDLGVVNIATDSDGETHTFERTEKTRKRYERIRSRLQAAGTKSARRHLKKLAKRERRMKRDTNHCISKHIVGKAKSTDRGISLEDLQGIRSPASGKTGFGDRNVVGMASGLSGSFAATSNISPVLPESRSYVSILRIRVRLAQSAVTANEQTAAAKRSVAEAVDTLLTPTSMLRRTFVVALLSCSVSSRRVRVLLMRSLSLQGQVRRFSGWVHDC